MELHEIDRDQATQRLAKIGKAKKKAEMEMVQKGEEENFSKLRKRKIDFKESIELKKKQKTD